jgi:hypothetical protein
MTLTMLPSLSNISSYFFFLDLSFLSFFFFFFFLSAFSGGTNIPFSSSSFYFLSFSSRAASFAAYSLAFLSASS